MNFKKFIKLKEEVPQDEPMSEDEELLFNSLVQMVQQKEVSDCVAVKRQVNPWKILTPAISFLSVIAITLTLIFTLNQTKDFKYNDANIISSLSTFTETKTDLNYVDVNYIEPYVNEIYMSYDAESNDKLYYSVLANIGTSKINLIIVINDKFKYNFKFTEEPTTRQLNDYTIIYSSESSRVDPQIKYMGWIQVETETVYFDYVQMPAMGDEAFFESIQQIIKLKN